MDRMGMLCGKTSGMDTLNEDPIGKFNLVPEDIADCMEHLMRLNLPLLVLGGGGYNPPNVARGWAAVTMRLAGCSKWLLPDEIPEHTFLNEYFPNFSMSVRRCKKTHETT